MQKKNKAIEIIKGTLFNIKEGYFGYQTRSPPKI